MKITFIKPRIGRGEESLYIDEGRMEPLQLAVLAGMTPPDIDVILYDDRMEEIPYDDPTDLVAITIETYTARRGYEIATEYRLRGIPVIVGGMHVTLLPEEASLYADSIVTGDGGWIWPQIVEEFKNTGKLQKHYQSQVGAPQANRYLPNRDIFEGKKYLNVGLIQFGRGCRFACSFCAIAVYFKNQQYVRDLDSVIEEIRSMNRSVLFFVDDNICADFEALKELCRKLIPLKIRWVSQGSLDMTRDLELMDLLAKSGCMGNVMGFETINPNNKRQIRKAPNFFRKNFSHYDKEVNILRDFGLQTWASFTLGYDFDTRESILETVDFAIEKKFCFAAFNILMPYPGTDLYRQLESENRLLYNGKWWLAPDYKFNHAAYRPKCMSAEELTELSFECKRRWNSPRSILSRFFDPKTHMRNLVKAFIYWRYNPLYGSENFRKQSMYFGLYNHMNDERQLIHANSHLKLSPDLSNIGQLNQDLTEFKDWRPCGESSVRRPQIVIEG